MSKRTRTNGGGFLDINPQQITATTLLPTAADDYHVAQIQLPVARFGTSKTKAWVVEMLSVTWYLSPSAVNGTGYSNWGTLMPIETRVQNATSTLVTAAEDIEDPRTISAVGVHRGVLTSGAVWFPMQIVEDLTDQEGNGVLVATQQIFMVCGNVGGSGASSSTVKIMYRLKEVGIQEFVGIVQSQQT